MKPAHKTVASVLFLWLIFIIPLSSSPASEQRLLLKNAKIYTMGEPGVLEKGMILVKDGKIEQVGREISAPPDARSLDLTGKTVIPGLVCATSSLFLHERDLKHAGEEEPDANILGGVDYFDRSIPEILKHGVTTVYISPVSFRSTGGLGAVVKLNSQEKGTIQILKDHAGLSFRLERLEDKKTSNLLRLTQYHRIRDQFVQAREYRKEWQDYEKKLDEYEAEKKKQEEKKQEPKMKPPAAKEPEKPKKDEAKELILQAMDKKIPVRFIVHRPDSILQALGLGKEFGLDIILEGGEDWPFVLSELEKSSTPLISSPLLDYGKFMIPGGERGYAAGLLKVGQNELFYSDEESLAGMKGEPDAWAKLARSKVPFALIPPDNFPLSARFMRLYASILSSLGLSLESALGAVTSEPAKILGVADRVGTLEKEKDADFVVLDGEPLNSLSAVDMVFVDGRAVWKRKP